MSDPLDEVMSGIQPPTPAQNELDSIMLDVAAEQRKRQRLMELAREATKTTPTEAANRITVGQKTGVAPSLLVDADTRASYEQMAKLMNVPVEKLTKSKIGEWVAQHPDNLAIAQNSFDPMFEIEGKHRAIEEHQRQVQEQNQREGVGWWRGMANSFSQGANQLLTIPGDLTEMALGLFGSPETMKGFQFWRKYVAPGVMGAGQLDQLGASNLEYLKSGPQRHRQDLLVRDPKTGQERFNWGAINLETVSAIVAQEAPAFAVSAALAPESGGVSLAPYMTRFGRAGKAITALVKYSTKAPALLETSRTATSIYNDGKQTLMAQGLSEEQAATKAAPGALLAGIFSSLAGSPMEAKFFEDLVEKTARIPGGFGIANQLRARSKALLSMGTKEGTQEVVQGMGEDLAQWLTFQPDMTLKQAGANAIMNFVGGFAMGGPAGSISVGSRSIQQQQNMDFMNALHEGAQQSEAYKLMPAKWQEMVDHLTKDGPIENIGVPVTQWNTFWQSQGVDPSEKAAELGVTPEEYQQAVQLDADLTIKTAEFATKIAGTEAYPELVQDVRFEQGAPTMREAEQQKQELAEEVKAILAKFDSEPEGAVSQAAEQLKQELMAAGRPEAEAAANAQSYRLVMATLAARNGIDPEELAQRYKLAVVDGQAVVQPQMALHQTDATSPEFRNWFGASKVVDESGKPLVVYHGTPTPGFDEFALERRGTRTGSEEAQHTFSFTNDRDRAEAYSEGYRAESAELYRQKFGQYPKITPPNAATYPVYLRMENPLIIHDKPILPETVAEAKANGNDGIIRTTSSGETEYQVFDPKQIKSAIGNRGTFDLNDPNILHQAAYHGSPYLEPLSSVDPSETPWTGLEPPSSDYRALMGEGKLGKDSMIADIKSLEPSEDKIDRRQVDKMKAIIEEGKEDLPPIVVSSEGDKLVVVDGHNRLQAARELGFTKIPVREFMERVDVLYQAAFHGSPYRFDKFSLEHLGKGEGAQAYGWGLYFAGDKSVAEYYRNVLTDYEPVLEGKPLEVKRGSPEDIAAAHLSDAMDAQSSSPYQFAAKKIRDAKAYSSESGNPEWVKKGDAALEVLAKWEAEGVTLEKRGQLYEVNIPESDTLLDWDKPLSEQPEKVRKALEKEIQQVRNEAMDSGPEWGDLHNPDEMEASTTGRDLYHRISDTLDNEARAEWVKERDRILAELGDTQSWTSAQSDEFQKHLDKNPNGDELASKYLHSLGINGIKYLDGSSRSKGEGSHNYVVFDDSAINILKTYYQGQTDKRGAYHAEARIIQLFDKANASTVAHELGHFYLEVLRDLASQDGASEQTKADYQTILKHYGTDGVLDRAAHERFADAHLLYLTEGKAPSEELKPVFQRFSRWLARIWGQVKAGMIDVKLNDEVRGVFDRLYASDQEIEAAKNDLGRIAATAEEAQMTEAEFRTYSEMAEKRIAEAKEKLVQKLMLEMQRERSKEHREFTQQTREQVTREILSRPEYQTLMALIKGRTADGTEVKLSRQALVDAGIDPKSLTKDGIKVVYTSEGGMDPDTAAMFLGYESGDALIKTLTGLESRTAIINRLTDERVREQFPDTTQNPVALRQAAIEALSDAPHAERVLALELRTIRKAQIATEPLLKQQRAEERADAAAAREAAQLPNMQAYREAARQMLKSHLAFKLNPYQHLLAQRKAANEAFKAMAKNDYEKAQAAKEREILSHFLYLETMAAREQVEKFVKEDKKFDISRFREKIGKAGGSYLAQIDALRQRFGLSERGIESLAEPREPLAVWAANNEFAEIDDRILDETWKKPYDQLTVEELGLVRDALANLKALAYQEFTVLKDGKRIELEAIESEIAERVAQHNTIQRVKRRTEARSLKEEAIAKLKGLDATLVKIEAIINWMDGGDVNGPAHRYIWDPLVQAQTLRYDMTLKIAAPLQAALQAMPEKQRKSLGDVFSVEGFDSPLTRAEIISMLFNLGNEQNQEKLLKGYNWTQAQVMAAVGNLNAADARFVQDVWDTIETLWPDMASLEKRYTGVEPKKVARTPFVLYDRQGNEIAKLEGGYWPLKYDPDDPKSDVGRKQANTGKGMLEENYSRPGTSRSASKERTRYTGKILLDFEYVLNQHINDVIMDISHREALNDVNKVLQQPSVKAAIQGAFGTEYYDQFNPWLKTIAGDSATAAALGLSVWNRAIMKFRNNSIAAVLGFKFTSTIVQTADVLRVIAPGDYRVPVTRFAGAFLQFVSRPKETMQMVHELSGEMRHRAENLDRDIHSMLQQMTGQQSLKDRWNRAAFKGLGFMDAIVSIPAWLGAYQQAMAEHSDSDRAVKEADRVVRMKLMSGNPKDLVGVQRNNEVMKLVTMFLGDASAQYNMMRNAGHKVDGIRGIPQFTMAAAIVMAGAMLGDLLKGQGPDDDDDKMAWVLRKASLAPFQTVPILRDGVNAFDNWIQDKPFTDYKFTPAFTPIQKVLAGVESTAELLGSEKPPETIDWAIKAGEAIGYAFGIGGTAQSAGIAKYLRRVDKGEEQPGSSAELVYDMIQNKPKAGTH